MEVRTRVGITGFFFAVAVVATSGVILAEDPQQDHGRIHCFLIGGVHPEVNPFTGFFMEDPLFGYGVEPIPPDISNEEKRRLDRIYYPRTRKDLVESFDMVIFRDARIDHFTTKQLHDLDYAFREAGMASLSTFGPAWETVWEPTILYDLAPISDYTSQWYRGIFWVRFRKERVPVFTPFIELGMEKVVGNAYHMMTPRQGAVVWGDMQPRNTPWLASWRPGGGNAGMQWAVADCFNALWWGVSGYMHSEGTTGVAGTNPYAIDFATNLILYSLDRPLINDIHARREARHLISLFNAEKLLIFSMMEWAESFGATTLPLSIRLAELDLEVEDAVNHYLDEDYQATIQLMQSVSDRVTEITGDAVRLKNEALYWVFVTEWLVVTSTSLATGFLVWSLMIRKRMYREIKSTRLR
jgi:hypothetical protein